MTNDFNLLKNFQQEKTIIGVAKCDENMTANGSGSIYGKECTLNKTLYVPDLTQNLLSVNAVTKNGGTVLFTKEAVKISKDSEIILEGKKQENGLYSVKITKEDEVSLLVKNQEDNWHVKLGHPSNVVLLTLMKMADGINLSETEIKNMEEKCEVWIAAKQTLYTLIFVVQ